MQMDISNCEAIEMQNNAKSFPNCIESTKNCFEFHNMK